MDEFKPASSSAPRTKQCRARLTMPDRLGTGEMVFTCTMRSHPESHSHSEYGRIRAKDGTVRTYNMSWHDAEPEVWRGHSNAS